MDDARSLRRAHALDALLLTAVSLAVLLPGLGSNRDWSGRETTHAEIAREMADRADLLAPTLLGEPWLERPPVLHAAIASLMRATGLRTILVARLPSVIGATAGLLAVYAIGCVFLPRRIARLTALALLGAPGWSGLARTARPEVLHGALVCLSAAALAGAMRARGRPARLAALGLAGLAAGLAVLAGGATGLIVPVLFAALVPIGRPDLVRPRILEIPIAVLGLAAGMAVWIAPAGAAALEALGQAETSGGWERPFHWFAGPLALDLLPLSILLPVAIHRWIAHGRSGLTALAAALLVAVALLPGKRGEGLLAIEPFLLLALAEALFLGPARTRGPATRFARALVPLSVFALFFHYTAVLAFLRPDGDPDFVFAREAVERIEPGATVVCLSKKAEDLAWVADRHEGIREVYNPRDALSLLDASGPGSYLVVSSRDRETILGARPAGSLELVFEYREDRRPWFLYRVRP